MQKEPSAAHNDYVRKLRRVAMIGVYAPDYARHAIIRQGLRDIGIEVEDMPAQSPQAGSVDQMRHLWDSFPWALHADVILIPAFNQMSGPLAWVLRQRYRKPVWLDYMVGLTDVQADRDTVGAAKRRAFRQIDRFNLRRLPSFTDTNAHRAELGRLLNMKTDHLHIVPVGVRDLVMFPPANMDAPLVQYAGTYIPFHGVDVILQAARQLPDVPFELIGKGQTYRAMRQLASDLALDNVTFVEGYFPKDELWTMQSRSTIMLGVFGAASKRDYVIPNKIYEALALGRPIITAEASALGEYLTVGKHLVTVPPADPDALAHAIHELLRDRDRQAKLRAEGRAHIHDKFLPRHIGTIVRDMLEGKQRAERG